MRTSSIHLIRSCVVAAIFCGAAATGHPAEADGNGVRVPGFARYPVPSNGLPVNSDPTDAREENFTWVAENQVLVRFRPGTSRTKRSTVASQFGGAVKSFRRQNGLPAVRAQAAPNRESVFDQMALLILPAGSDLRETIRQLNRHPDVMYAEPDYRLSIAQAGLPPIVPDDFNFEDMWNLRNTGQEEGVEDVDIDAPEAWAYGTGSKDVIVAVVDTGVDFLHPDLASNIWNNPGEIPGNGVDDDGNGFIDDWHGYDFVSDDGDPMDDQDHGTHVAGSIGAVGNNKIGVTGVCWQVSLMALKSFDEEGNGRTSDSIQAIQYAMDNGARIINASWGNEELSQGLEDVIREANQAGVLFVAAAGNKNNDKPFYPAAFEETLAVGAINRKGEKARFSSYGPFVDIAAPGDVVLSTFPNNKYAKLSGTSMAAPQVSGLAALILSDHPEFTSDEIANIIVNAVDVLEIEKPLGSGLINAAKAVRINTPLPTTRLDLPEKIYGEIQIRGAAFGEDFIRYTLWHGEGKFPETWTEFYSATQPVEDGVLLENFDTSTLSEGTHTIRLTAENSSGYLSESRAVVEVSNVHIADPFNNDIIRLGDVVEIDGTVFGLGRTYRIEYGVGTSPTEWNTDGITLVDGGRNETVDGRLATWDTAGLEPHEFYALRLTASTPDEDREEFIVRVIYLDDAIKEGWPQRLPRTTDYPKDYWRMVNAADLDGDGIQEILTMDPGDEETIPTTLHVYRSNGEPAAVFDLGIGGPVSEIPAVGDLEGNGANEILVFAGSPTRLLALQWDGTELHKLWSAPISTLSGAKAIADLDHDGRSEIIVRAERENSITGQLEGKLIVLNAEGQSIAEWAIGACDHDADVLPTQPAIGNFDEDDDLEIVAVTGCDELSAFDLTEPSKPLWQAFLNGQLVASPVVGDVEADGHDEIVIGARHPEKRSNGGVHLLKYDGTPYPGWPVLLEESFESSAALADFDNDGDLEICISNQKNRTIHLLHHNGFDAEGWPVKKIPTASINSHPLVGDIDGDGSLDVIIASPGFFNIHVVPNPIEPFYSGVLAWSSKGESIDLNPRTNYNFIALEGSGAHIPLKFTPPILADLENNGYLDLVTVSMDDLAFSKGIINAFPKNRGSLTVHELGVPFNKELFPWPQFQINAAQTGRFEFPPHINEPPSVLEIADQIIPVGGTFFPIMLDRHVDDPDHAADEITWRAQPTGSLRVEIDENRVARVITPSSDWTGSESIRFIATDPEGASSEWTATFTARAGYQPPVLQSDSATLDEDGSVKIDVLANDSDPFGNALFITQIDRPLHGTASVLDQVEIQYSPDPDFAGVDSFTYVASTDEGGISVGSVSITVNPVNDPPVAEPDRAILLEDENARIDVLENDFDVEGDTLELVSFEQPGNGVLTSLGNGRVHYHPRPNFFGLDRFTYVVADSHRAESVGEALFRVKPVNDPPLVHDQSITMNRNTTKTISFDGDDPDNDDLEYEIIQGPVNGIVLEFPAVAEYEPERGFSGADGFTYRATDGLATSAEASVSITILDENNPPKAKSDSYRTLVNQAIPVHLTATDADEDPLTFEITQMTEHGTIGGSQTNYFYTPNTGYLGEDSLMFQASDGMDFSDETRIRITVTDVNTAPTTRSQSFTTRMNEPLDLTLEGEDGEGTVLTFFIVAPPAHGNLTGASPEFTYTPDPDFVGFDRFTFFADDGALQSKAATAFIDVKFPNDPPTAEDKSYRLLDRDQLQLELPVTDPEDDPLIAVILKGPKHGRVFGSGTSFTYVRDEDYLGEDGFTFQVWDGYAYSNTGEVVISIEDANGNLDVVIRSIQLESGSEVLLRVQPAFPGTIFIESSEDLVHWEPVQSSPTSGESVRFEIPIIDGQNKQFFRASLINGDAAQ